eukprot:gene36474-biopygen6755
MGTEGAQGVHTERGEWEAECNGSSPLVTLRGSVQASSTATALGKAISCHGQWRRDGLGVLPTVCGGLQGEPYDVVDYALAVGPGEGKAEKAVVMQCNCRESDLTVAVPTSWKGAFEKPVETSVDFDQLLELGTSVRTTVATGMKDTSSRSHCIFTVYIEMQSSVTGESRNSKVPLVDLADNERVAKAGFALSQESISINTSRSTLNRSFAR